MRQRLFGSLARIDGRGTELGVGSLCRIFDLSRAWIGGVSFPGFSNTRRVCSKLALKRSSSAQVGTPRRGGPSMGQEPSRTFETPGSLHCFFAALARPPSWWELHLLFVFWPWRLSILTARCQIGPGTRPEALSRPFFAGSSATDQVSAPSSIRQIFKKPVRWALSTGKERSSN